MFTTKEKSILIVDDDEDLTNLYETFLKFDGYKVDAFTDPIDALSSFRKDVMATYSLRARHVPLVEHLANDIFPTALCNDQHAFLRFAEHDFIRRHPWLASWYFGQIDFDTAASAACRFAC